MTRKILAHDPGGRSRPLGPTPVGGRAPTGAASHPARRRWSTRSARPRVVITVSAGVAGLCVLAFCAVVTPGFALGAGGAAAAAAAPPLVAESPSATQEPAGITADATAGATGNGAGRSIPTNAASLADGDLLVTLPWGSEPGAVGLAQPGEGLARGPEALAVAADGRIAVLDSVNSRLLFLDPAGEATGSAKIPLAEPRFLAVDESTIYVLDCDADKRVETFDWNGESLGALELPELGDVVTALLATEQGVCVEIAHDQTLLLSPAPGSFQAASIQTEPSRAASGRGAPARVTARGLAGRPLDRGLRHAARASFEPGGTASISLFDVEAGSLQSRQKKDSSPVLAQGRTLEHLVSIDGDGRGGMVVGARLLKPENKGGQLMSLALTRLAAPAADAAARTGAGSKAKQDGAPGGAPARDQLSVESTLLLADSTYVYLGQPYVVAPDGRVFQPWADETGYSILIHSFAETTEVKP